MENPKPPVSGNPAQPATSQSANASGGIPMSKDAASVANTNQFQHPKPGIIMPQAQQNPGTVDVPKPAPMLRPPDSQRPLPVAQASVSASGGAGKITAFGKERRHEDAWQRTPNTTGHGAIHVKTFHCKLTEDALAYMDSLVNSWLDEHPQYEVKFVSSTIGTMTGKLKEPALFCQVWV